jgi:hypothetical protein
MSDRALPRDEALAALDAFDAEHAHRSLRHFTDVDAFDAETSDEVRIDELLTAERRAELLRERVHLSRERVVIDRAVLHAACSHWAIERLFFE